jgi:hypothetical protein
MPSNTYKGIAGFGHALLARDESAQGVGASPP